jgi:O-antigen ligase
MAGRLGLAFGVFLMTVNGASTIGRLRTIVLAIAASGAAAAGFVLLEYQGFDFVIGFLAEFRERIAVVGTYIRAGGTFQYPTIASMFLEVVFALGLGLLLLAIDSRRLLAAAATGALLLACAHAITLTFTRAGLLTMASSLLLVAALRYRRAGLDRGFWAVAIVSVLVGLLFVSSRSFELLQLRMTTEGHDNWYQASYEGPRQIALRTGERTTVSVVVTNTGRTTWNTRSSQPFLLSYHWLLADSDRVVSWEGLRTELSGPVAPGARTTIAARVQAPRLPGEYRLMWDLVQERRLWLSTEPGAVIQVSQASVTGPALGPRPTMMALPRAAVRPGRLRLWTAAAKIVGERPLFGIGPDNYRLVYGPYAGLTNFDPRVHSNNMYLEMLAGGGFAGGLAFLWLSWRAGRTVLNTLTASRHTRHEALAFGIAAAVAAIALHGLLDSFWSFTGTYVLIAITLGLAAACPPAQTVAVDSPDAHRI